MMIEAEDFAGLLRQRACHSDSVFAADIQQDQKIIILVHKPALYIVDSFDESELGLKMLQIYICLNLREIVLRYR
jgi:hypothetical protein